MPTKIFTAMIVDDNEFDQLCAERILDRSGMVDRVLCFSYADEALAFLGQPDRRNIDVILLDINMPRMSGFEFLEHATRKLGPDFAEIVVVMLTTSLNPADAAKANAFSVVKDYFTKALTPEHVTRVCELLETTHLNTTNQKVDYGH